MSSFHGVVGTLRLVDQREKTQQRGVYAGSRPPTDGEMSSLLSSSPGAMPSLGTKGPLENATWN